MTSVIRGLALQHSQTASVVRGTRPIRYSQSVHGALPMASFAHYTTRSVEMVNFIDEDDPWFAENQPDDQGLTRPTYHVTRSKTGPAARVAPKDTIWLFSQLKSPFGTLPPALDAKIVVSSIAKRAVAGNGGFRYEAHPELSRWFPLRDVSTTLLELNTIDFRRNNSPLLKGPSQHIGRALQNMRELKSDEPLLRFEKECDGLPYDFVSYRILDGTQYAFLQVCALVGSGKCVWWDRWSLPRRLAERREFLSNNSLDKHIMDSIGGSESVWGVESDGYGKEGTYSAKEKAEAKRLGKLTG